MLRKLALALIAPLLLLGCASEADDAAVETDDDVDAAPSTGDGEAGGSALAALRAAPDAAAAAGSGRFEMTLGFEVPGDGVHEMAASGGFDGERMAMEMDLGAMLSALAEDAGEQLPPGFEEPMRMVFADGTFYFRMPMLDLLTGTAGWLTATPEDFGQSNEMMGLSGTSASPTAMLETLRGVADDVEQVGTEDVRGVETTRYRATIDLDAVLETVPDEQREMVEAQLDQMRSMGIDSMPVELWIDDEGLLRRMTTSYEGLDQAATGLGSMTMTMEMFDYGEPFEVEVPPASEVTPMVDVMPGMPGGAG